MLDGHQIATTCAASAAIDLLREESFDVVLSELRLPGAGGLAVLGAARALDGGPDVVLMSASPTVEEVVEAMRLGAHDYLAKPCAPADVLRAVASALGCQECDERHAVRSCPPFEEPGVPDLESAPEVPFRTFVEAACERVSSDYLVALMRAFRGNVTCAARRAGMQRISLLRLLKRHRVVPAAFRPSA